MGEDAPRPEPARRGLTLSYRGRQLLSRYDPASQAEKAAAALPVLPRTLYFCPSPLFGYGLAVLLGRMGPDSAVLCLEADPALEEATRPHSDEVSFSDPRVARCSTDEPAAACALARRAFGARRFRRVVAARLNSAWTLNAAAYEAVEAALRSDIATDWGNAATLWKLGRRYALNAVRNLALLPRSARLRDGAFGAAPILVLGAGPSLDAALDRMGGGLVDPTVRASFRVVCVDTALKPALARGLRPDLVVALEAQHWNLRDFAGTAGTACDVAMDLSALPATARATGGRTFLFSTRWAPLSFLDRLEAAGLLPPEFPPLGSVGLAATAVARRLTSGPVAVAGLDFSYALDAFHARSSPGREDALRTATRLKPILDVGPALRPRVVRCPAKDGGRVYSDPVLRAYRDLFRREFSKVGMMVDLGPSGLDLGLPRTDSGEWIARIAAETGNAATADCRKLADADPAADARDVLIFVREEIARLEELRGILTGRIGAEPGRVEALVDEGDYLWTHFPDCAGTEGRRPPADDLSFLKRVRAEIDPFMAAFAFAERETLSLLSS